MTFNEMKPRVADTHSSGFTAAGAAEAAGGNNVGCLSLKTYF